ncbi:cholecystokinin receptor-like [Anneissia japonica]|uniref:cholecystokinin receptor-like n=1 Tax=Anneissia japonica TaxID=1529436 RepID=UPI00142559F0|nr:cholecystokinin receptor-like [Anneissia japonica]
MHTSDNFTQGLQEDSNWNVFKTVQLIQGILGIIENIVIIIAFIRVKKIRTITNIFILNLSVTDFVTAVATIPMPAPHPVPDTLAGELYCRIIGSNFFLWTAIKASVLTMVAVTVERYASIVAPLRHRGFSMRRAVVIITLAWVVSIIVNSFSLSVTRNVGGTCKDVWPGEIFQKFIGLIIFLLTYLLPLIIMIVAYATMFYVLRKQDRRFRRDGVLGQINEYSYCKAKRNVAESLFLIVLAFTICWAPDQISFLAQNMANFDYVNSSVYPYFVLLAFCHPITDPMIYVYKNRQFRNAIKSAFKKKYKITVRSDVEQFMPKHNVPLNSR